VQNNRRLAVFLYRFAHITSPVLMFEFARRGARRNGIGVENIHFSRSNV
jgi:hypothetical protein